MKDYVNSIWSCINCRMRVETSCDFHINSRPICVQCNAEMEPYVPDVTPSVGRRELLEEFFRTVADLTLNHGVIEYQSPVDPTHAGEKSVAIVSPQDLGKALAKVDPEWWKLR